MDADAQTRGTEQRAQKWTHVSEVNCSVTKGQEHTTGGGNTLLSAWRGEAGQPRVRQRTGPPSHQHQTSASGLVLHVRPKTINLLEKLLPVSVAIFWP